MQKINKDINDITKIAKKVILKMSQWDIPITPENYLVWFEYFIEDNNELIKEINEHINSGKIFTKKINEDLYYKYFMHENHDQIINIANKETQTVLERVFHNIVLSNKVNLHYKKKLTNYSTEFSAIKEIKKIRALLANIAKDTKKTIKYNIYLEKEFTKTQDYTKKISKKLKDAEDFILHDLLTGLLNRKAFERKLNVYLDNLQNNKNEKFCLMKFEIDSFKKIIEGYDAQIVREILQVFANYLRYTLKGHDVIAKFSSEAFITLLPETSLENACIVAEQVRKNISKKKITIIETNEEIKDITISGGVAVVNEKDNIDSLLKRVDMALLLAKHNSKNNVKSEQDIKNVNKEIFK